MTSKLILVSITYVVGIVSLTKPGNWGQLRRNCLSNSVLHLTALVLIKPNFHSHFSLVDSKRFCMGHANRTEINRARPKSIFVLSAFEIQNISTSANFPYSETNQCSLLSHVDISRRSNNFFKWPLSSSIGFENLTSYIQ